MSRGLIGVALATLALAICGLVAIRWVRSPQQVLAETAPPPATTLSWAVERRVLAATTVIRGRVTAEASSEVLLRPAASEYEPIVTGLPLGAGDEITEGSVLVEVSGRPVIALPGSIPAYRDIRPGDSGDDVLQLQLALSSLGFDPGPFDGQMGARTGEALDALYVSVGYDVASFGDDTDLEATQDAIRSMDRRLVGLLDSVQTAADESSPDDRSDLEREVINLREDLRLARDKLASERALLGPFLPVSEVAYFERFPVRIAESYAFHGYPAESPIMTIKVGDLSVVARVARDQRGLLSEGMEVEIFSEVLGESAGGRIESIGDIQFDVETGLSGHNMAISLTSELQPAFADQDVRVTIETASTPDQVLVVPTTAVYASADGTTSVLRILPDDVTERVTVTVGVVAGGYLEIMIVDGQLNPGDLVVVGQISPEADG